MTTVDFSTTILGQKTSMPIYITATALGKLGHPEGELNLTRAAATKDIIQMVRTRKASSMLGELIISPPSIRLSRNRFQLWRVAHLTRS